MSGQNARLTLKQNLERFRDAERKRASEYRARRRASGQRNVSGQTQSKWARAEFIALDGEGENAGEVETHATANKIYTSREHIYTLLAASTGESLYRNGTRLDTYDIIDWLLDLGEEYARAIFVIFAGGYDINHWLLFGFDRLLLGELSRGEPLEFCRNDVWYYIEYRNRKSLTLKRNKIFYQDSKGRHKVKWSACITIWDVFGFFQESFVGVMGKWLGLKHPHYELIKKMKGLRGDFENVEQREINAYNQAELSCLVELMEKVWSGIDGLGLKCLRWDGAGAVAASMFRAHKIRDYKSDIFEPVREAVRTAYAGGRIELCKIGTYHGNVYDYDVNSAYPAVMHSCPCLAHGVWRHGGPDTAPPRGFTLVHLRFDFNPGQRFYPLFYRTRHMQISYPQQGEGWYWFPEYEAALSCPGIVDVLEWWHFDNACTHQPFSWIKNYYETRRKWVKNPDDDWQLGGEKIIKLGLNSLYGKTAQQLGAKDGKPPAYHQMEWAGYITSATRARLFIAASKDPDAIIGFATDGIFSVRPLDIECSITKEMGEWELKEPLPRGLTVAMAGVYWWHMGPDKYSHFSRGFDKDSMKTPKLITDAWAAGYDKIDIPMYRLIGMGTASVSDIMWQMRGRFAVGMRCLALDGHSHKRQGIDIKKARPHKQLVNLEPSPNLEYGYGEQACSFPYPVLWNDDYAAQLEEDAEAADTENV